MHSYNTQMHARAFKYVCERLTLSFVLIFKFPKYRIKFTLRQLSIEIVVKYTQLLTRFWQEEWRHDKKQNLRTPNSPFVLSC